MLHIYKWMYIMACTLYSLYALHHAEQVILHENYIKVAADINRILNDIYYTLEFQGPTGPLFQLLQRAGSLRSPAWGLRPTSYPLKVGTEAHTNRQKDGDRSTYEQANVWGQKHLRTNKRVGTEAHMNKQKGWGRNHIRT